MSDLVGNPEDRFSCVAAQLRNTYFLHSTHFKALNISLKVHSFPENRKTEYFLHMNKNLIQSNQIWSAKILCPIQSKQIQYYVRHLGRKLFLCHL